MQERGKSRQIEENQTDLAALKKNEINETQCECVSEWSECERTRPIYTHTYAATIVDDFKYLRHYVAWLCSLEIIRIQIVWNKWKRLSWAKNRSHTELAYENNWNYKSHISRRCAASTHEIRKSLVKTKIQNIIIIVFCGFECVRARSRFDFIWTVGMLRTHQILIALDISDNNYPVASSLLSLHHRHQRRIWFSIRNVNEKKNFSFIQTNSIFDTHTNKHDSHNVG